MTELKVLTDYDFIGGEQNIRRLVDRFYHYMDTLPDARPVRDMHSQELSGARDKLFSFLSGWLGGPQLYQEAYGHPQLRMRHLPFRIGPAERDQWMQCMTLALDDIEISDATRKHLLEAFARVADHMVNQPRNGL